MDLSGIHPVRNKGLIRFKSEAGELFYERQIVNYGRKGRYER